MTLQTWKKTFKKANQRVDKAFANYLAFLETHVAIDENGEASPLDDGSILRMDWFAGRKSGWQIMCYASEECYQIGRYTKTGKLVTSGLKTARRLEERLENAIKNRNYWLGIIESNARRLNYNVYADDSVWTREAQQTIL